MRTTFCNRQPDQEMKDTTDAQKRGPEDHINIIILIN